MNINHKLHLITIFPLVIALTAVMIVTHLQYRALSNQLVNAYRESVIDDRKEELRNYISIAEGAIKNVIEDSNLTQAEAQNLAKKILAEMRFGENGYFFAYDYAGNSLVLPEQEWRVGKNWLYATDKNGVHYIQKLIEKAENGGGYLNYLFNQPSKGGLVSKKLAYSEALGDWDWMFGTGIYLDDIDEQTDLLSASISKHISNTSLSSLVIGFLSVMAVFTAGVFIRISEKRLANIKLRALNERIFQTQEEECKRVSRELHDGVSQTVAAARFSLETAQLKQEVGDDASPDLEKATELIRQIMLDIRSISHQLHPGILEDYGLGAALKEFGREFSLRTGIEVEVQRLAVRKILSTEISGALYRIAQESLTNIERHSGATQVQISLALTPGWLTLEIADNGKGFDYLGMEKCMKPNEGIGLRNMKERLSFYNGVLKVQSSEGKGTSLLARIPQSELRYNADNAYDGGL